MGTGVRLGRGVRRGGAGVGVVLGGVGVCAAETADVGNPVALAASAGGGVAGAGVSAGGGPVSPAQAVSPHKPTIIQINVRLGGTLPLTREQAIRNQAGYSGPKYPITNPQFLSFKAHSRPGA